MKKTLSLILAALLLASSMTACGNTVGKTEPKETETSETKTVETNAPATEAPATDPVETEAPAPSYDPSLITENGIAKAHIVLPDGAAQAEKIGAAELQYHIKKEYYSLLQQSWAFGSETITYEYNMENYYGTGPDIYYNFFIDVKNDDDVHFLSAMRDALNAAWEKADDRAKVHIRYIKEVYDTAEELIPNLSPVYE